MDIIEQYLSEIETAVQRLSRQDIRSVVAVLESVWERQATTYIIGNGGSAATASHMMNDLCKFTRIEGQKPFRAIALTDNVPLMTAVGNDISFDDIFIHPLENVLRPGDVLVAISGSGNSRNIIRACEYALENMATVIGFCGSPGGMLAKLANHRIIFPADRIGQQEDGHLILNHVVALALRERIQARNSHQALLQA